jgi:hypothetical protein
MTAYGASLRLDSSQVISAYGPKAEAGEPLLAPIYEFTASFRKWPSIVFTAGGSCSG